MGEGGGGVGNRCSVYGRMGMATRVHKLPIGVRQNTQKKLGDGGGGSN